MNIAGGRPRHQSVTETRRSPICLKEKLVRVSERARYIRNLIGRGLVATTLALGSNPQILPQTAEAVGCSLDLDYETLISTNSKTLDFDFVVLPERNCDNFKYVHLHMYIFICTSSADTSK